MRYHTIYREVPDIYNPDPDALIEVAITVSFTVLGPDPDVGIFCSCAEDICVSETDSDLFPVEWAEAWLDSGYDRLADGYDKAAERALDDIQEAANSIEDDWEY